jgi:hypothetical protein
MYVSAHFLLNMDRGDVDPNAPAIPQQNTAAPMADMETQLMVLDMANADCAKLEAMNHEVKHAFLLTNIFLQRPGSLSKIVGPDCEFLGKANQVAAINDDSLTLTSKREILYHIPKMDVLVVSHVETDSIAYGFFIDTDREPLEYFLEHREEAERSAAIARSFASVIEDIELPVFDPTATTTERVDRQASSEATKKATSSRTRKDSITTSPTPLVPTDTSTPPGFTPPSGSTEVPANNTVGVPVVSDSNEFAQGDFNVIYVEKPPSDPLPSIQPLGPVPQPEPPSQGAGYWIFMIFLTLVLIGTAVIVLKSRVTAKQGMIDE